MRFVNKFQDKNERRLKYSIMKNAGLNPPMRRRCRDWTWNHIILLITSNNFNNKQEG